MSIRCPYGYVLDDRRCLSTCPHNFVVLMTDVSTCVSLIACPANTIEVDQIDCQKSFEAPLPNGSCARGAMWAPDVCYYPNCSAPYIENGTTCLKRSVLRNVAEPYCSNPFFSYDGQTCTNLSTLAYVCLFLVVFASLCLLFFNNKDGPATETKKCKK